MKRLTKIIVVIMIAVFALSALACGEDGKVTLVVVGDETSVYTVDTTGKELSTLKDLMDYLVENEEFTYEETGGFLTTANGKAPSETEFWGIYTDLVINEIEYYNDDWGTATYEGIMYGSATKGIVELPLSGGATYLLKLTVMEW